jgi:hypothetical protein
MTRTRPSSPSNPPHSFSRELILLQTQAADMQAAITNLQTFTPSQSEMAEVQRQMASLQETLRPQPEEGMRTKGAQPSTIVLLPNPTPSHRTAQTHHTHPSSTTHTSQRYATTRWFWCFISFWFRLWHGCLCGFQLPICWGSRIHCKGSVVWWRRRRLGKDLMLIDRLDRWSRRIK